MEEKRYIISDAAKMVDVESHVLRYWEEELGIQIPRNEMGHRYYTDKEIKLFTNVRDLKEKGFQLKAIKLILATITDEITMDEDNIISINELRKEAPAQNEGQAIGPVDEGKELVESPDNAKDKMSHFKYIMDSIVAQALRENNSELEQQISTQVSDIVLRELDEIVRLQEERDEDRYQKLDQAIRGKIRGRKEAAAAKLPPYRPTGVNKRWHFWGK